MEKKIPPPNFKKKKLDDQKFFLPEKEMHEKQSKHLVSFSIFPSPSSILQPFDKTFDKYAEAVINMYPEKLSDDKEILLNEEQYKQLKDEILKERENQLSAEYTNIKKDYLCRFEEAMSVKTVTETDNFMVKNIYC